MCINCMSQLDVVTISSAGLVGAGSAGVRQLLTRLHLLGRARPVDPDARVVAFLRSLDLDPAEHLDLDASRLSADARTGRVTAPVC